MAVIKPQEIDDFSIPSDTVDLTLPSYSSTYGAIPSISMNDLTLGNISFSSGTSTTYTLGAGGSHANAVWTTTGIGTSATGIDWSALSPRTSIDQTGQISLKGDKADIDINGKSMKAWMEQVEQRLNLLTTNPDLEKEWDELRELGERYRALEKLCKEKAEAWNKLKSMPPAPDTL